MERRDLFTLKTEDGIFVLLKGLINKQQTCANGFSEEAFKHFLIGFPPNWEECAEKCFQQGIGSEATADADLNPEQSAVTKMGNATAKLKQKLWKDSDCNNRLEHTDEAQEAVTELDCQERDTCMNTGSYDSNVGLMEGVRYHLRNRKVCYSKAEGVYRGKRKSNVKGNSSPKKTMIGDDTSTIPSVASLENSQTPDVTSLLGKSSKEKGEASVTCNSMHKINEAQKSQRHDDIEPIPKNAGKDKNLISDHSLGGNPRKSKKKKRNERKTTLKTCTSKAESKAAVAEQERKTSQGSTPKLRSRRKLNYDQETTCTPEGPNKTPTSQSSVLRTSRSGRVLLPTMEFWRSQLPIYDADRGVFAIREGSTILKVKTQKGQKSRAKES